mmetsp:Transcript_16877/g.31038  ORF Transcript_16877/g.31038 Transcript_16877/m.31038 type:complete len:383 (-) Transcript_16877:63-1211(-)
MDRGQRDDGTARDFGATRYGMLRPCGVVGKVPPPDLGLDVDVGHLGTRRAELAALSLSELEELCRRAGAVAFSSRSRRFFKCLVDQDRWVKASDVEDELWVLEDAPPPWHLADVFMKLPKSAGQEEFHELSIEIEVLSPVKQSANLYVCCLGGWTNLGPFYAGLQTNIGAPFCERGPLQCSSAKTLSKARSQGPQERVGEDYGAIFSRWGPANMDDAAVCAADAFAEAASYEGDFVSVRRHLDWASEPKVVLFRLARETQSSTGTWVRCEVESNETVEVVGWLFFRGTEPLKFRNTEIYSFFEIYGEDPGFSMDAFDPCSYESRNLQFNGRPIKPHTRVIHYRDVPQLATCTRDPFRPDWHVTTTFVPPNNRADYGTYVLWP